jgi:mannose-6-phosphate isomerase-like protein (cupin superfamily)
MGRVLVLVFVMASSVAGQERKVDPTWLYRDVSKSSEHAVDFSNDGCKYTPIFGEGDANAGVPKSVLRFGQVTVAAHGECKAVEYARQEELYFVEEGAGVIYAGEESHPLKKDDFSYVAPTVRHHVSNSSDQPLKLILVTVKILSDTTIGKPSKLEVANLSELEEQTVGGHPKSVLYKLMIGPHNAKRDRINATYTVVDFFLMDFAPGGTNFPHHHETAEEIYLVLDGEGQMAAGGGMDGIEGLHAAKAGDAYYFRQNCTVGFYNQKASAVKAHILAVRVWVPIPKNDD